MARKRRLHQRYGGKKLRKNPESPSYRGNPPVLAEIFEFAGPGFAAFAATRLLTRLAAVQIAQRKPEWAKHAGAIASIGSLAAAWFGAHRVKMLAKYQTPIIVGSAIAAAQSIIQLYIPKLGWMIADASPEVAQAGSMMVSSPAQGPDPSLTIAAAKLQPVPEDPAWYTYDDSYDAGRYAKESGASSPAASASAQPNPSKQREEALLADLQLDDESNLGVFSN